MVPCSLAITSDKWAGESTINVGCVEGLGGAMGGLCLTISSACVYLCMSISTLRQHPTALCRWMCNRSRHLTTLYKYIITILSRSWAQSDSEHNVNSCLRARFSSLLLSDWQASRILSDSSHVLNPKYVLMSSGRRYRVPMCKYNRYKQFFVPSSCAAPAEQTEEVTQMHEAVKVPSPDVIEECMLQVGCIYLLIFLCIFDVFIVMCGLPQFPWYETNFSHGRW